MSKPRQARIIILRDLIAMILVFGVTYKSEMRPPDDRVPMVTLLQCKTLRSHEYPLFERQGSYERPRGTFRMSLNERRLFLVCTDRVFRQPNLRAGRNQDGRLENRTPGLD